MWAFQSVLCLLPFRWCSKELGEPILVLLAPFYAVLSEQNVHNLFEQSFLSLYSTLT